MEYKLRNYDNGNHARRTIVSFLIILILLFLSFNIFQPTDQTTYSVSAGQTSTNEPGPMNLTAVALDRFSIQLNWDKKENSDYTLIECADFDDNTWNMDDHELLNITNGSTYIHRNLLPGTQMFYKVWQLNESYPPWIINETTSATTESNNPPKCDLTCPVNGSIDQELSFDLEVTLFDLDGDLFDFSIQLGSNGPYTGSINGNVSVAYPIESLDYNTTYSIYVNMSDEYDTGTYHHFFKTRSIYLPTRPSGLQAETKSSESILLNWSKGEKADKTYIEYHENTSWNRGEGTEIYNDTNTEYYHIHLNPHTTYYYQAWSWNDTDNIFSTFFSNTSGLTLNNPPECSNYSIEYKNVFYPLSISWTTYIHDQDDDDLNWNISCSNGDTINDIGKSGEKKLDISDLHYNMTYTVWVNVSDSFDTTIEQFNFTTLPENHRPEIISIYPSDGSSIPIDALTNITVTIEDFESNLFNWNITTDPPIGNMSGIDASNGNYSCPVKNTTKGTQYIWNISILEQGSQRWTNGTFSFTISDDSSGGGSPGGGGGSPGSGGSISPPISDSSEGIVVDTGGPYQGFTNEPFEVTGINSKTNDNTTIEGYRWDFTDDGTWDTNWSTSPVASALYSKEGNYTLRLEIKANNTTAQATTDVIIVHYNHPPSITVLSSVADTVLLNEVWEVTVKGNDLDGEQIRFKIQWDEDHEENWTDYYPSDTTLTFDHSWDTTGTKAIKLLVEDESFTRSQWTTIGIIMVNKYDIDALRKQVQPTIGGMEIMNHESISFHAYNDGFIHPSIKTVSVSWNFGDNLTASGIWVNHSYERGGHYMVTCVYITDDGQVFTSEAMITVSQQQIFSLSQNIYLWIVLFSCILIIFVTIFMKLRKKKEKTNRKTTSRRFSLPRKRTPGSSRFLKSEKPDISSYQNPLRNPLLLTGKHTKHQTELYADEEWDSFLFKPVTIAGVYYEMEEKKRRAEQIQNAINDTIESSMQPPKINEQNKEDNLE